MLANTLTVPARRRLEGRSPIRLGDVVRDMDSITPEEIASVTFDSEKQAINTYKFLVRAVAVRTKVAYLSDLLAQIQSVPGLSQAFMASEDGQKQLQALMAARDTFLSLTQPNMFQNLQMLRNHLEVNVFPKTYNLGIEGRLPMFQVGQKELSYSDVLVEKPATFSFGDLSKSGLVEDLQELKALGNSIDSSIKLAGAILIIILVIVGIWGALGIIWGMIYAGQAKWRALSDLLTWAKANGIDMQKIQDILDRIDKAGDVWSGASSALKWAAILLGTGVAGYIAWNIFA